MSLAVGLAITRRHGLNNTCTIFARDQEKRVKLGRKKSNLCAKSSCVIRCRPQVGCAFSVRGGEHAHYNVWPLPRPLHWPRVCSGVCTQWLGLMGGGGGGRTHSKQLIPGVCDSLLTDHWKQTGSTQCPFGTVIIHKKQWTSGCSSLFQWGSVSIYYHIIITVNFTFRPQETAGQKCCYDVNGNFIIGPPGGGYISLQGLQWPCANGFSSIMLCCTGNGAHCEAYYSQSPSGEEDDYRLPIPGDLTKKQM